MDNNSQELYTQSLSLTLKIGNLLKQKQAIQKQLREIQDEEGHVLSQIAELTKKLESTNGQPETDPKQNL